MAYSNGEGCECLMSNREVVEIWKNGELAQQPIKADVEKLELKPGDILLVNVLEKNMPEARQKKLENIIGQLLPEGVKVIIYKKDKFEFSIITPKVLL